MYIYKFRVTIDEVDDFVRDIEISANQNFEDFFYAITACTELDAKTLSSFFICDAKWRRKKEITLVDMGIDDDKSSYVNDDEDEFEDSPRIPVSLMKNEKISEAIDDPHQRIIFMYDYMKPMLMYIELLKTIESLNDINYPRCTFREAKLPITLKNNFPIIGAIGDDEFDNLANVDDEDVPEDDIMEEVIEEDDIEGLDDIIHEFEGDKF